MFDPCQCYLVKINSLKQSKKTFSFLDTKKRFAEIINITKVCGSRASLGIHTCSYHSLCQESRSAGRGIPVLYANPLLCLNKLRLSPNSLDNYVCICCCEQFEATEKHPAPHRQPWGCRSLSVQVHLLEEGLSKLVGAYHDSAGWGHFDHPGHETWGQNTKHFSMVSYHCFPLLNTNETEKCVPAKRPL